MLTVARLSTTPVRSFALHHPDAIELTPLGPIDDRRFSLHTDDGRLFDATKNGALVQHRAELERGSDGSERLTMHLATGETIAADVELGPPQPLHFHKRTFTAREVIGPWAAALSDWAGKPLRIYRSERIADQPDRNAVSIVSDASVHELARQGNEGRPVDSRRFRMLIELTGAERPHQEDEWLGCRVRIGEALVRVTRPDPRCVITTQHPDTGARDFPTLHVIRGYRGARNGEDLEFGVYADVLGPGRVAVGDPVEPLTPGLGH